MNFAIGQESLERLAELLEAFDYAGSKGIEIHAEVALLPHPDPDLDVERVTVKIGYFNGKHYLLASDPELTEDLS